MHHAPPAPVSCVDVPLPGGVPAFASRGWWSPPRSAAARAAMCQAAAGLPVAGGGRTLVLGDEELMYLPQLLAAALGDDTRTSTTTRTPAVALDRPGYPLRTVLSFGSTDDGCRPAYAYNVAASRQPERGNAPGFDHIVFVTDAPAGPRTARVVDALAGAAGRRPRRDPCRRPGWPTGRLGWPAALGTPCWAVATAPTRSASCSPTCPGTRLSSACTSASRRSSAGATTPRCCRSSTRRAPSTSRCSTRCSRSSPARSPSTSGLSPRWRSLPGAAGPCWSRSPGQALRSGS